MGHDAAMWRVQARVDKREWGRDPLARTRSGPLRAAVFAELGVSPDEVVERPGNLLVTAGLTRLMSLLNGAGGQAVTNTATRLGTGNGAGSAAVGDTDLGAAAGWRTGGSRSWTPPTRAWPPTS